MSEPAAPREEPAALDLAPYRETVRDALEKERIVLITPQGLTEILDELEHSRAALNERERADYHAWQRRNEAPTVYSEADSRAAAAEGCRWCGGNGQLETYNASGEIDEATQCVCILSYEFRAALRSMKDGEASAVAISDLRDALERCRGERDALWGWLEGAIQWVEQDGLSDLTENELAEAYAYSDQPDVERDALAESERRSWIARARAALGEVTQ